MHAYKYKERKRVDSYWKENLQQQEERRQK